MLVRAHIVRLIAVLAVLVQVALPVAQAQATADGTPLASLICNPSGQPLKGHRLAIEYGVPLHRDLNGPQLETDNVLTLVWQTAF